MYAAGAVYKMCTNAFVFMKNMKGVKDVIQLSAVGAFRNIYIYNHVYEKSCLHERVIKTLSSLYINKEYKKESKC